MNFELSKPQQLLRETARASLSKNCPKARARELMLTETSFDPGLWRDISDQGWITLHLPLDSGGLGLGLVELAVVAEETSRACLPGPFLSTVWAATLLAAINNPSVSPVYLNAIVEGNLKATVAVLEPASGWNLDDVQLKLEKSNGSFQLNGRKSFVLDAAIADLILCVVRSGSELALVAIPRGAAGMSIKARPALDATRKMYDVEFHNLVVTNQQVLASGTQARSALEYAAQVATLVVCAETVGAMQWVLESTVEYAKTRQQFGQVIGSFQAVQQQCADMLLHTESGRAATSFAAWALTAGEAESAKAVSVAKAFCSDKGREVCNHGVQVHGGIGFTWEHDLHLYLKKVTVCEFLFGDASHHREQIARAILD